jgi:hypothetical protein
MPRRRTLFRVLTLSGLALTVLALPAASGATTFHGALRAHTTQATDQSRLQAGGILLDGSALVSASGKYRLVLQSDGNLVLYWEGHPLWNSGTRNDAPDHLVMQTDGNLVMYQGLQVLWSSGSGGGVRSNDYYLTVQNDGDAIIYSPARAQIWTTNTAVQPGLQLGDSGISVRRLQERLSELGYWLGPPNGVFGDSTQQAVWALQKAAGLSRDGVVGTRTVFALASGVVPKPRPAAGNLIEVDLEDDLVMVLQGGKLAYTLNTSTGGGYTYTDKTGTSVAITPKGVFHIFGVINGLDVDSLGTLWRPRFFTEGGIAIHGDTYVPPIPVSHGCVRVSNEAINWIWANNIAPIGEEVWVF